MKIRDDAQEDCRFITQLYEQYHRMVLNAIRLKCNSNEQQDHEDLLQEVFLCALKKRKEVQSHPNPLGWLLQTAMYCTYNFNRTQARRSQQAFPISTQPPLEEVVLNRMERETISDAAAEKQILAQLSQAERNLYDLRFVQKLSYQQIAEVLSIKPNLVGVRLLRLKRTLQKLIANFLEDQL